MLRTVAGWGRFGWWLAVFGFVLAGRAIAEEAPRVEVAIAADPAVSEGILAVLHDSLARRGLGVDAAVVPRMDPLQLARPSPGGKPAAPVARVWLDLVAPQPIMYFVTEPSGMVYVRPLAVHAAPDTVELELIRFVVDGALQAILEGQPLGVTRAEFARSLAPALAAPPFPLRPPPPSPAPPAARVRPRWVFAAAYSGARLSPGVVVHGPGLAVDLLWPRLRLGVVLLQRFPVTLSTPDVSASSPAASAVLVASGARLFAALPARLTARLLASVGIGAGVDVTRVAPSGTGATSAFWVTDPLVLGMAGVQQSFARIVAAVDAGVEVDLIAPRYAALRPGQTVAVWTPERWRPFVTARLGIAF